MATSGTLHLLISNCSRLEIEIQSTSASKTLPEAKQLETILHAVLETLQTIQQDMNDAELDSLRPLFSACTKLMPILDEKVKAMGRTSPLRWFSSRSGITTLVGELQGINTALLREKDSQCSSKGLAPSSHGPPPRYAEATSTYTNLQPGQGIASPASNFTAMPDWGSAVEEMDTRALIPEDHTRKTGGFRALGDLNRSKGVTFSYLSCYRYRGKNRFCAIWEEDGPETIPFLGHDRNGICGAIETLNDCIWRASTSYIDVQDNVRYASLFEKQPSVVLRDRKSEFVLE
ncbi:hypothetical protein P152DRAFT_296978 [Eremomyces bilateralis CBS 781.70]|uniref:Uncharacterized protein n=1 Tax=Eremomyces bilateralis CBS 781.70 TaxID=1392243 RepID=A0A6G1G7B0_9PEZI|nr:uncharacterized protein P152DRAFT_296978 [Eremomyces bilateralis CBS 781.70]KAF1813892.1 hypothetical protein P152DRAFT_296978 [Eremomyces bilateralis CBS 781.70]